MHDADRARNLLSDLAASDQPDLRAHLAEPKISGLIAGVAGSSPFLASLMQRGLVERATDKEDRRRAPLRLTFAGRTMHAQIVPLALKYEADLYRGLSVEERQALNSLCDRLFTHAKLLRSGA